MPEDLKTQIKDARKFVHSSDRLSLRAFIRDCLPLVNAKHSDVLQFVESRGISNLSTNGNSDSMDFSPSPLTGGFIFELWQLLQTPAPNGKKMVVPDDVWASVYDRIKQPGPQMLASLNLG